MSYFVLLDDAVAGSATLFQKLVYSEHLPPEQIGGLDACLKKGWAEGRHVVVLSDYEFGMPLQHLPAKSGYLSLYWFADKTLVDDPEKWLADCGGNEPAGLASLENGVGEDAYSDAVGRIKEAIARGDTYQINYTVRLYAKAYGNPVKLYSRLRQPVPYAALACLPDRKEQSIWVLCFSPELFLRITPNGEILTEPMKGTAPVLNDGRDEYRAQALRKDPKNRAENTMIVDLLRNDLGRVAETGSVRVPEPFKVSRFGFVWQMTSMVRAQAKPGTGVADIFHAAFPCGSITGAPKRMSMQLIDELETETRGLYTGTIGHLAPNAGGIGFHGVFNVVIRTLVLKPENAAGFREAVYGVGSGIVWDSLSETEYAECSWKARFLTDLAPDFSLIETLRVENRQIDLLAYHLRRLAQSAKELNFSYSEADAAELVHAVCAALPDTPHRLKITLLPDGTLRYETGLVGVLDGLQYVVLSDSPLPDAGFLRRFKTNCRAVFDEAWQQAEKSGAFDSLLFNQSGFLLEGGRSNVFLLIDGKWHTPPISLNILNGVMRQAVFDRPEHYLGKYPLLESRLTKQDVLRAEKILLSNALRGVFEVALVTK